VVLLAIGLENAVSYLYFRARDFASWAAYNAAETRLARDVIQYRDRYDLYFDPLLTAHLTTRYLAPDFGDYRHFDPATVFPIQGAEREGVLLFIAPDTHPVRDQAHALYPGVRVKVFAHPYSGNVVLHKYFFDRDEIVSVQGLDAAYVSLQAGRVDTPNQGLLSRIDDQIDHSWADDPPVAYPFEATWTGGLLAPTYGTYTLRVDAPGEFMVTLDGETILSNSEGRERSIILAQGVHSLHVNARIGDGGEVHLLWATPSNGTLRPVPQHALYCSVWPVRGLLGRFYPNADWSGQPEFARIDRQLGYYFHYLPLDRPYTVEWVGRLAAPISGTYHLGVDAVSSASLYIDGRQVIERGMPEQHSDAELYLEAGMHDIVVRYLDDRSHSRIYLYWQLPESARQLIPFDALYLPLDGTWQPAP
jgi:hypothetical protein